MTSTSQSEVPTPTIKCGPYLSVKARSPAGPTTRIDIVQYKIDVRSLHCRRLLFRMGTTRGGRPPACAAHPDPNSEHRWLGVSVRPAGVSVAESDAQPKPTNRPTQSYMHAAMQALPLASVQWLRLANKSLSLW